MHFVRCVLDLRRRLVYYDMPDYKQENISFTAAKPGRPLSGANGPGDEHSATAGEEAEKQ